MRIRINVVPNASAYERLVGAYTSDLWVRIHMTCGCVCNTCGCVYSGVRIQWGAYTGGAYTVGCVYSGVRIQWGAYTGVRIQECVYIWTCAYAILVGAYARLVGAYTYDLWVRIQWGAYTVGCVYRGAYAGVCMQG